MDAFFASVEQRDNPSLKGKPVVVGGTERRGVVAAASYEVRRFGVRSAMPMAEAMRRCPGAVIVAPRHSRYAAVSAQVFEIFLRYTPLVEGLSLDEAFLDVTASESLFGEGVTIAERIRHEIKNELSLTASAGVAPSKFVAKIASDINKPDGLTVVRKDDVRAFLAPLPIDRMWGIGKKTAEIFRGRGIATFADLAEREPAALTAIIGKQGPRLRDLALGIDPRAVVPDRDPKSIGAEVTYDQDLHGESVVLQSLLAHSARVASRLHENSFAGRVVTVKIKYSDFSVVSKQETLDIAIDDTDSIFASAGKLLKKISLQGRGVRLTGVSVSDLTDARGPRSLFADPQQDKRRTLENVTAQLKTRFGPSTLTRGSLLGAKPR